ncbi:MAG TPA: ZTL protein [Thermoanaerobaculia bacterium]|nr:ZTL protein [Thermoanaerobaculia bacterium]
MEPSEVFLFILGGVNGAGKSSVLGPAVRRKLAFYNPDAVAQLIRQATARFPAQANAAAWQEGRRRLAEAIAKRHSYAFESTLGGSTITRMLLEAAAQQFDIYVWFIGLSSPEQHIERVRARVAAGGHDIPDEQIRKRWLSARRNLIALMPVVKELVVYDNSADRDAATGLLPEPRLLLHWSRDEGIIAPPHQTLAGTPEWAKPIVAQALKLTRR